MPHRLVVIILALCVVAASCGDDDGTDPGAEGEDTTTSTTTEGGDEEEPLPTSLAELVGPVPSMDAGAAQQWYLDREVERQEAMAECMADAGFEYVPIDPAELSETPWSAEIEWESSEWVETYGFGASTLRFPQAVVGPTLVGYTDPANDAEPHPNQVYVDGLSEEDREAWSAALSDCDSSTWSSSQSENLAAAFNERFSQEITAMYDEMRDDPRYEDIHAEVRSCVSEAGFDYVDHETFLNDIEARLAPLDEEARQGALSPAAIEELGRIQADEIAVATAVDDCGGRFLSENPAYQDLVAEYEASFIAEHEDALRDFLAEA